MEWNGTERNTANNVLNFIDIYTLNQAENVSSFFNSDEVYENIVVLIRRE